MSDSAKWHQPALSRCFARRQTQKQPFIGLSSVAGTFSLGEACDLPMLCKDVASVVDVQEDDVPNWVEWLGREHLPEIQPIREQVTAVVKHSVLSKTNWEKLSMEDLSHIYHAAKRHKRSE